LDIFENKLVSAYLKIQTVTKMFSGLKPKITAVGLEKGGGLIRIGLEPLVFSRQAY